jgi:branched-chain amino acid transport system substrate-binding protein
VLAAVTRSPALMAIEDVAEPGPVRAGNVIVAPEAVGICGSDFHLYSGDVGALSGLREFYPRIQGHEVSAIVTDPGDAGAFSAGDRVAILPLLPCGGCYPCRVGRPNVCVRFRLVGVHIDGGLAERLEVPAANVFPVGDHMQPDCTAFVEPASVVVHALSRARLTRGEQVVIFGAGPIGLATALAAVHAGARVLSVDPVPARRDLAKRLGAERTATAAADELQDEVREWAGGEGPPLVVETSGEPSVLPQAIEMVSAAGRVVVVGMSSGTAAIRPGAFPEKEIDVIGSSCATAEDFRRAIVLISAHSASLAGLFTHHFTLARAAEAFEFAMSRSPDAIKVVVTVELGTGEGGHVRTHRNMPRARRALLLVGTAALALGAAAGCSSSSSSSSSASSTPTSTTAASPSTAAVSTSQCGTKPGVAATGTPIPLGVIVTNQPGTSFTDISNMANAYFTCVNANGGVNGHPIKYYIETEQTNPAQITAEAKQLVDTDHVVGIVGNTSIIECAVDSSYWAKLGYDVIGSGIASQCWATPNNITVNMGPRYSSDGAVQYALAQHVSKIVFDQSNVPGTGYIAAGPNALAKAAGVPIVQLTENVPISDADSVAIKEVDDAGPNGAVVLNFTPPEALVILQAAQKLGLEDRVKLWGCSTPCNTDFLAASLGPKWNSKLFVNAELAPPDSTNTPTMNLYKAIYKQYGKAVSGGIGSFSQMGFTEAEIAVHALETVKGAYTVASVNAAFRAVSNYNTGMLCQLWTYGDYPMHIANNEDYTVTPDNGKMVQVQGCTQISSVDPQIAAYRSAAGTAPLAPVKS